MRDQLGLALDQQRLLERHHLRFVRSGAQLGSVAKARMQEIAERLATLHTLFGQNVLHDEDEWRLVLDEAELDGLPDFARAAAAAAAKERGLDGRFVITLARASVEPFLSVSARRDLRRAAYDAWAARGTKAGDYDHAPLSGEIMKLRAEQAHLLGYDNFAAYRLDDTMAKTPEAAGELLREVWEPAKRKAAEECGELTALARSSGLNETIEKWDWRYYAERVRADKYALDEAELKPYFVLDNMVAAAFDTAGRLFGIRFVERKDCPVYHPDVRAYEVQDQSGRAIGLFLHDNFARPGKHSGAWMSSYRIQEQLDTDEVLPIVVNNNNFSKGEPTLLSFDDARTLFHEFGHGLHGLLSRVRYPSQSGTSVRRDFVEFPSQVFEHWLSVPETLRRYACHFRTGEPLPEALLERASLRREISIRALQPSNTPRARCSISISTPAPIPRQPMTSRPMRRNFLAGIGMPAEIGLHGIARRISSTCFAGGGYAAGYYAYLWAEVLDADGFAAASPRQATPSSRTLPPASRQSTAPATPRIR